MKLNGQELKNDNIILVVIPRKSGNLAFYFQPVLDWEEDFDALCKKPNPPRVRLPNNVVNPKLDDPKYIAAMAEYIGRRSHYLFLRSIAKTEGLEWSTIKMEDPSTWANWEKELTAAGFTQPEQNAMFEAYLEANTLNDEYLDRARESFLREQEAAAKLAAQSSLDTEQQITQSGELASE